MTEIAGGLSEEGDQMYKGGAHHYKDEAHHYKEPGRKAPVKEPERE